MLCLYWFEIRKIFLSKVSNKSFVSIVLIDCIRYSALLKIITEIFYKTDGINRRKSEENNYKGLFYWRNSDVLSLLFLVITYIILFQLDSVGLKFLRGFINSVQLRQVRIGILFRCQYCFYPRSFADCWHPYFLIKLSFPCI